MNFRENVPKSCLGKCYFSSRFFLTSFLKRSLFSSFFGAFYDCYEIAVLWFEQKNFLCFHNEKTEIFSQFGTKPTMFKLLKLNRSSQNSLFGQVAGPFQEIISQPHNIYQSNFIFFHCLKCLCLCALTLNRKSL